MRSVSPRRIRCPQAAGTDHASLIREILRWLSEDPTTPPWYDPINLVKGGFAAAGAKLGLRFAKKAIPAIIGGSSASGVSAGAASSAFAGLSPTLKYGALRLSLIRPSAGSTQGIYVIRKSNGSVYVGQSGNISTRLAQHVKSGKYTQAEVNAAESFSVGGGKTAGDGRADEAEQSRWEAEARSPEQGESDRQRPAQALPALVQVPGRMSLFREFTIEDELGGLVDRGEGPTLVVTGRWTQKATEALERSGIDAVELNVVRGFKERSLEFLEGLDIRWLLILDGRLDDLSPLAHIGETLEELTISEAAPGTTVPLDVLPRLRHLRVEWSMVRDALESVEGSQLRRLYVEGCDHVDLAPFGDLGHLEYLELVAPRHLNSLFGIDALSSIADLRISLAPKLTDLGGIESAAKTLEKLELETCKQIDSLEPVGALKLLRELWIADCGEIESLGPLRGLEHLEIFEAWESTRVLDGDLTPLTELANLRELRMQDRKSYSPRVSAVIENLSASAA